MDNACCFTGYRPEKFPFEIEFGAPEFTAFENKIYDAVFALPRENITDFYCGMAMGFDLLAGKAVVDLKRTSVNSFVRLIAVIPFKEQPSNFPPMWKKLYDIVLKEADEVILLSDNYYKGCFQKRNEYMVDNSNTVITYFDGQRGGTANTLRYAASKKKRIINIAEYNLEDVYNDYPSYETEDEY